MIQRSSGTGGGTQGKLNSHRFELGEQHDRRQRSSGLAKALKINSTLTILNLDQNSTGDNGAQALSEALKTNSTLTTLELQVLPEALKSDSTLTTLELWCNKIGYIGALALSAALKTSSTLTTLELWLNLIRDNGAQAMSKALKVNSTLTTLSLESNSVGDNGAQVLSETLKSNSTLTTLGLENNSIGDNGTQLREPVLADLFRLPASDRLIGFEACNWECTAEQHDIAPEAAEKVVIVGWMGMGRSRLTGALFRLVEMTIGDPPHSGGISIDGIDISQIVMHDLCVKMGIIS
ncbi:hypothetical protein BG006_002390 [Podila minutissima]|uniref:RNI-like protein n=1 Tax=Podila minutissima TaxID=64525 RepID=A0A9P5S9E8_9FUNG|nr:hypothetical protein BG006_002390 [Podila minutissima]